MAEFWDLTLREVALVLQGHTEARVQQRQNLIEAAYLGAFAQRAKRWPKLPRLLPKMPDWRRRSRPSRPAPTADLLATVRMWHAAMGGEPRA